MVVCACQEADGVALSRRPNAVFANILIASDGTDESDHVVSVAQLLERQSRSRVVAAHVTQWRTLRGFQYREYPDEALRRLKVRSQVADLQAAGLDAQVRMNSTLRLAQIARDAGADLIVIGGSRHGTLAGLLLGSVGQRMPRLASCPVLVVPPLKRPPRLTRWWLR